MRVLILSCNAGEGHNSCAKAIKESFQEQGIYCEVADALKFISKHFTKFFSSWHVRLYKYLPKLYGVGYSFTEKHPKIFNNSSFVYNGFGRGAKNLVKYAESKDFDTVICTHVFAALMVAKGREKFSDWNIHCALVDTDYTYTPSTADSHMDRYFIPDKCFMDDYINAGVSEDHITVSGIPVQHAFQNSFSTEQARTQLGLPIDCRHILMMSGSMGCGPIERLADLLSSGLMDDEYVSIVCGTNRRVYKRLLKKLGDNPHYRLYEYVDNVSLLMDSADLFLTKGGGLSLTEAEAKGLPMVLIQAVSGYESDNIRYFVNKGCAVYEPTIQGLARRSLSLLNDKSALFRMIAACDPNRASQIITEQMQKDISDS